MGHPRGAGESETDGGGLTTAEAAARLRRDGANEVPERPTHPVRRFLGRFWNQSAWMIELIAGLSAYLHRWVDLVVAVALLVVNAVLGFVQEQRASAALAALRRRLQVTARVLRDARWTAIAARELVAGDVVRVRAGDLVPADVRILDGGVTVDESTLTGESRPLDRAAGELLHAASIVRQGEATARVDATGTRTLFGRTTELVAAARPRLHADAVIARVVRWLFIIVGVQVVVALIAAFAGGLRAVEVLPLSLVLLMSAIPVALPVMFTVSTALGSLALSRRGVLVTRLGALEDAATMDVVCADKTGTLTLNRLRLTGTIPRPGFDDDAVIRAGALASNEADQDPIDAAFLAAARSRGLVSDADVRVEFHPFSAATRCTEAVVETEGVRRRYLKGALATLAARAGVAPAELEADAAGATAAGARVLAVARADGDRPLQVIGLATLADPLREDSRALVGELRGLGIGVKLLTGDALAVASSVAGQLGLGSIARAPELRAARERSERTAVELVTTHDGLAEVFPEDKFLVVESLQRAGHVVGMTGDGVNDAPALRQAEVGVAVGGATDVAKGAASAVLTTDGLAGIVDLVGAGRAIYQRLLTWIVNKVSRTVLKVGYVTVALLATGRLVVSALAMVLLVFMTDFVKIALATDRVRTSARPATWRIGPHVQVAVALGALMLLEALLLLAAGWRWFELARRPYLATFAFQTLLFFALASIVSIRERRAFWRSRPSGVLLAALVADGALGAVIGLTGLGDLRPIPPAATVVIAAVAAGCGLGVNDLVKTWLWRGRGEPIA